MAGLISTLLHRFSPEKKPVYTTQATSGSRYETAPVGIQYKEVRVSEVIRETADAVTLRFQVLRGEPLAFRPGQFLTFVLRIDGREVRRAYSFSSCPLDPAFASVTIKRVADGLVSRHMNENVNPGDLLQVLGPSGEFVAKASSEAVRHFVFVAGGSGITPLMSLTHTLLRQEPQSKIDLLYGNRGIDDIIFHERLRELSGEHANLTVHHVLQHPPVDWKGEAGLLTGDKVLALTGSLTDKEFYICGPEAMMNGAVEALRSAGVDAARIKTERFISPAQRTEKHITTTFPITFAKSGTTVQPKVGETVLEAGLNAGLPLIYSCTLGGCAACRIKVKHGTVEMEEPNCLSPEERQRGYILACVACPTSPLEVEA